jgi:hypothetical protein
MGRLKLARIGFGAKLPEQRHHRAPIGKRRLDEVQGDKASEQKPVRTVIIAEQ